MTEQEWLSCNEPIEMLEFLRGNPTTPDTVTWWNSIWRFGEGADKGMDRKFRLFACACCRRIWEQIPEACNRDAVVAVENYLEGSISASALETAFIASSAVEYKEDGSGKRSEPGYWAVKYLGRGFYKMTAPASALLVTSYVMFMADEDYHEKARFEFTCSYCTGEGYFLRPFQWPSPVPAATAAERLTHAKLLRCILGNPFRPLSPPSPSLLTPRVRDLAEAAYRDRIMPQGTLDPEKLRELADDLRDAGCHEPAIMGHLREPDAVHVRGCHVIDALTGRE